MTEQNIPLLIEDRGSVRIWTINRHEQRNAITDDDMVAAFQAAASAVAASPEVRCVVLTGAGSAFSSGGNVRDIAEGNGYFGYAPFPQARAYRAGIQRIPSALYALDVPLVAAVNGPAIGAGFDLALVCDLRIASTAASFAESFVTIGLIPGDGGAWLLPRVVGHARATELTLTGRRIDAEQALAWGIVSSVVPPEQLLDAALELAESVAANPPHAVQLAKRLLRDSAAQSLESHLVAAATMQAIAHSTDDHHEAVTALLERRPAHYSGH
jgi:enoyl-CoA hydratase/carnithine racemase